MPSLRAVSGLLDASAMVVEMGAQETPDPVTFTEHLFDKCACRWVSYKDIGGWFLQEAHPGCPMHKQKEET